MTILLTLLSKYWKPLVVLLALVALWCDGYHVANSHTAERIAVLVAAQKLSVAQSEAVAGARYAALNAQIADSDAKHISDLQERQNENDALRASTQRLHISATCPRNVPSAASSSSVGVAVQAELSPQARSDILDLRSAILELEAQSAERQNILTLERVAPLSH